MGATRDIAVMELTLSKKRGKAFTEEQASKLSPQGLLSIKGNEDLSSKPRKVGQRKPDRVK